MGTMPLPCEATTALLGQLAAGEVELRGRIPWSSNATFLVTVNSAGQPPVLAIYKPAKGERPLWDFPRGLWRREVAAYQLDSFLEWGLVPPTVARKEAPLGPGSLQYCVDAVAEGHYFSLLSSPEHLPALRRVAAFDLVANNADRKAGHTLLDSEGRVWAIDNGLCFHREPKLRTVIWDFAGEPLGDELAEDIGKLARGSLPGALTSLLDEEEVEALLARAKALRRRGRFPEPRGDYPYPWPLI
jgi:hypothetical protein